MAGMVLWRFQEPDGWNVAEGRFQVAGLDLDILAGVAVVEYPYKVPLAMRGTAGTGLGETFGKHKGFAVPPDRPSK